MARSAPNASLQQFSTFESLQESVTADEDLHRDYTTSQLGLHDLLREWRAEMDAYSREAGRYRYTTGNSAQRLLHILLLPVLFIGFVTKHRVKMTIFHEYKECSLRLVILYVQNQQLVAPLQADGDRVVRLPRGGEDHDVLQHAAGERKRLPFQLLPAGPAAEQQRLLGSTTGRPVDGQYAQRTVGQLGGKCPQPHSSTW